ncbi:MAG: hypothetical protein ABL309_07085 [Phycisphaerales bacterium]
MGYGTQSRKALWLIASVGWVLCHPTGASAVDPSSESVNAHPQTHAVIWSDAEPRLLVAPADFRLGGLRTLSLRELLEIRRPSMLGQSVLRATGLTGAVRAAASSQAHPGSIWVIASIEAVYHADPSRYRPEPEDDLALHIDEQIAPDDSFAPVSVRHIPRRSKDLFVGVLQKRWDDPTNDFLPSKMNEMLEAYPTPGAASLLLIAGACAAGRRRR